MTLFSYVLSISVSFYITNQFELGILSKACVLGGGTVCCKELWYVLDNWIGSTCFQNYSDDLIQEW